MFNSIEECKTKLYNGLNLIFKFDTEAYEERRQKKTLERRYAEKMKHRELQIPKGINNETIKDIMYRYLKRS